VHKKFQRLSKCTFEERYNVIQKNQKFVNEQKQRFIKYKFFSVADVKRNVNVELFY